MPGCDTDTQAGIGGERGSFALCGLNHAPQCVLCPTGLHSTACVSSFKARYALHTEPVRVVAAFARETGGTTDIEPATDGLLLNTLGADQDENFN